jgi:DNA ligase-1
MLHRVSLIIKMSFLGASRIRIVPYTLCNTLEDLLAADTKYLKLGYEGTIIRNPAGIYKEGRSTVAEGGLLRIKRFTEEEAVVKGIVEGQQNTNASVVNETGHTSRSTHAENMIPNGMVGSLLCQDVKTGQGITVAAGCMPHADRMMYFQHPEMITGQTIKYKTFKHGKKDLPRFPTFQSIRAASDIG